MHFCSLWAVTLAHAQSTLWGLQQFSLEPLQGGMWQYISDTAHVVCTVHSCFPSESWSVFVRRNWSKASSIIWPTFVALDPQVMRGTERKYITHWTGYRLLQSGNPYNLVMYLHDLANIVNLHYTNWLISRHDQPWPMDLMVKIWDNFNAKVPVLDLVDLFGKIGGPACFSQTHLRGVGNS